AAASPPAEPPMEVRTAVQQPPRLAGPEPRTGAPPPVWHEWLRSPLLICTVACFVLAALSAALLPTVPSYDPWAWIVWGREVFDPHLSFATGGGPSWKPLPVFFTAIYGLFGGAGPTMWVITARAGGLLALVAAYRVAARLIRPEAWPFLFIYGVWLWRSEPRLRLLVVAGFAAVPFFWFVPPWIGSGQPFLAASHAKEYNGHLGRHPILEVLRRGVDL